MNFIVVVWLVWTRVCANYLRLQSIGSRSWLKLLSGSRTYVHKHRVKAEWMVPKIPKWISCCSLIDVDVKPRVEPWTMASQTKGKSKHAYVVFFFVIMCRGRGHVQCLVVIYRLWCRYFTDLAHFRTMWAECGPWTNISVTRLICMISHKTEKCMLIMWIWKRIRKSGVGYILIVISILS